MNITRSRLSFRLPAGIVLLAALPGLRPTSALAQMRDTASCEVALPTVLAVSDDWADYQRVAQVAGRAPLRSGAARRLSDLAVRPACATAADVPWIGRPALVLTRWRIHVLPFVLHTEQNSAYPVDAANGALWGGRGLSLAMGGGVAARRGIFSASFAPRVDYQRNVPFSTVVMTVPGYSPFIYPWHATAIDLPQRFGDGGFIGIDPGQSYLRADVAGVAAGLSTENLWWGPARFNPIVMSDAAPGFPHLFLGTSEPVNVGIGHLEARGTWGRLHESDYYDGDPGNDHTYFAGLVLALEPSPLPGLFLGFTRAFIEQMPASGLGLGDYLFDPYLGAGTASADAGSDRLFSLFARWVLPASGFEAYAEWARQQGWHSLRDLLNEPDRAQGYTLGFQQVVTFADRRWLRFYGELTHLGAATTVRTGEPAATFYADGRTPHGYTNGGQLLGAPIGPGSDAEQLGLDVFVPRGRVGFYLSRTRFDDDAYFEAFAPYVGYTGHDIQFAGGLRYVLRIAAFSATGDAGYAYRHNRDFTVFGRDFIERNWSLRTTLTWRP